MWVSGISGQLQDSEHSEESANGWEVHLHDEW